MKSMALKLCFSLILVVVSVVTVSASTLDIIVNQEVSVRYRVSQLTHHQQHNLTTVEAFNLPRESWQQQVSSPVLVSEGKSWLAIDIVNNSENSTNFYLILNSGLQIDEMQVYIQKFANVVSELNITRHYNSYASTHLPIAPKKTTRVYLVVKASGQTELGIEVLNTEEFAEQLSTSQYFTGIAIGGMAALSVMMLFLYIANRSYSLIILFGYFTIQTLNLAVLLGINLYAFFPQFPSLKGIEIPLLTAMSSILLMWFTRYLFELKKSSALLNKALRLSSWLLLLYLPISMLMPLNDNLIISKLIVLYVGGFLFATAIVLANQGQRLARLFLLVMAIHLLLNITNIITDTWYGFDPVLNAVSFWLHCLLMAFIMSRQYYYQSKDRIRAQQEALENEMISRQAQDELLALQQETQEQLESRVQERTLELNIALQELEEVNRELEEKNTLDELTGLFNRRHYDQKILAEFRRSRRNLTPLTLVVIDIDHFKAINDNYGHLAGDNCLVSLAQHLKGCLRRSTDIGFRYGGEEFCILLPETDTEGAIALAEDLRQIIANTPCVFEEKTISMTISCGIATYRQQKNIEPEQIFNAADKALYQAKNSGRNQVIAFEINEG